MVRSGIDPEGQKGKGEKSPPTRRLSPQQIYGELYPQFELRLHSRFRGFNMF